MRAFPQMQTQAIRMYNVKLLRNFHSECPAPAPWSSPRRWVIPAAPTTLAQEKNSGDARLVMFQSYYQCSDQVGEMFVYRDSHRGAVTRGRDGAGPGVRGCDPDIQETLPSLPGHPRNQCQ